MKDHKNMQMIRDLMFRLLPVQVLLATIPAVNGFVSSYFATNYVGIDAMSAVGLFGPISMLLGSVATMIAGGAMILCGKYLGANDKKKLQEIFSLDLLISILTTIVFTIVLLAMCLFDWTIVFTKDDVIRPIFNRYILGQIIGFLPQVLSNQLPGFLTMENKGRRTMVASIVYIAVNIILNYVFVQILHMEEFGLALSSSLGMWVFLAVQAEYYFHKDSMLKLSLKGASLKNVLPIIQIGFPGAASNIYQTIRGLITNKLLEVYVGSVGLSAHAAAGNIMNIFWSLPAGMLAVSRLLISVSYGEEDKQTLTDIMRVTFRYFIPMMCVTIAGIILGAGPLTYIFFKDTASTVYAMCANGLRMLPLCMPFSIILMHFTCYAQVANKQAYVNILALLDGVVFVAGFSVLLVPSMGVDGVYIANVLNGIGTTIYIVAYAWIMNKHMPKNMEELMVIDKHFGADEKDRIDISVRSMEEVIAVSQQVQAFCLEKGVDKKRAYLAGLAMEEMAGNIVDHGFTKDKKKHSIDIRVTYRDDKTILRIKDDCVPFDPKVRSAAQDDPAKNIGIRMIYKIMKDIDYQNMLGLNVLTIRI